MYLEKEQEKALTRTLNKIMRKHRIHYTGLRYVWNPICFKHGAKIGNGSFCVKPTDRDLRRLKGAIPELVSSLRKTAVACKWQGGFDWVTITDLGITIPQAKTLK